MPSKMWQNKNNQFACEILTWSGSAWEYFFLILKDPKEFSFGLWITFTTPFHFGGLTVRCRSVCCIWVTALSLFLMALWKTNWSKMIKEGNCFLSWTTLTIVWKVPFIFSLKLWLWLFSVFGPVSCPGYMRLLTCIHFRKRAHKAGYGGKGGQILETV